MKNLSIWDKIYGLFFVAFPLSVLVLYNQLPQTIGIHRSRGEFDQFVDKPIYLLIYPFIMGLYYYYSKVRRGDGPTNRMLMILILLAAHGMILYFNFFNTL